MAEDCVKHKSQTREVPLVKSVGRERWSFWLNRRLRDLIQQCQHNHLMRRTRFPLHSTQMFPLKNHFYVLGWWRMKVKIILWRHSRLFFCLLPNLYFRFSYLTGLYHCLKTRARSKGRWVWYRTAFYETCSIVQCHVRSCFQVAIDPNYGSHIYHSWNLLDIEVLAYSVQCQRRRYAVTCKPYLKVRPRKNILAGCGAWCTLQYL